MFSPEALSGYLSTAIFTLISVLIMVLILKKFLLTPLKKAVSERQDIFNNEMDEINKQKEKVEALKQEAYEELKEAQKKAHELLVEAQRVATQQEETILSEAKKEANEILSKAEQEAKRIHTMALQETRDQVIKLSLNLASKIVAKRLDENEERKFIGKFLEEHCENNSDTH